MPSVCIAFANGCPRSRMDNVLLQHYFVANGWELCSKFKAADLIVVSTCGFSQRAETKSLNMLRIVRRKAKPGAKIVITGCLPGINEEALAEFDAVHLPPVRLPNINQIAPGPVAVETVDDPNDLHQELRAAQHCFNLWDRLTAEMDLSRLFRWRVSGVLTRKSAMPQEPVDPGVFCLRVAHSCLGECTFCAIKHASGPLRSKPLLQIMNEFERGLRQGYRYFTLIAGDLGAYGQDIGLNIGDLMRELLSRSGDFVLHCKELNPRWLIAYQEDLLPMFAANSHRIATMMVPVQSGSDRILSLMRRGHTAADARDVLRGLHCLCPETCLDTHVLVGFPGETEEDFEETVAFLKDTPLRRVETYLYEDRPKTEASTMPNKISRPTIVRRAHRLRREFPRIAQVCY